jgi:hypothetical protein
MELRRLGRVVNHDPRSKLYRVHPAKDVSQLLSIRHKRHIPVLYQGNLGSCTGNAALGVIGSSPFFEALPDSLKPSTDNPGEAEARAVELYSIATGIDEFNGSYPPTDTGSSGLAVAKACKRLGLISGYRHAMGLDEVLSALANVPAIAGIPWYETFDHPDSQGNLYLAAKATARGGHEICLDELDMANRRVGFTNSWGPQWGREGRAYILFDDLSRLLSERGDCTVLVPRNEPAPVPNNADKHPGPHCQGCPMSPEGMN